MVKKIFIAVYCIITVFLYSVGDFSPIQNFYINIFEQPEQPSETKMLPEYPKGTIHIYLDEATFPTELQLVDIVQRPKDTPKIISWNLLRFPNLDLHEYNVTALKFGFIKGLSTYDEGKIKAIMNELKSLKDNDFVIHANLLWVASIMPFLRELPKEKIKHIYLYEDGLANHLASTTPLPAVKMDSFNEKELTQMIQSDDIFLSKYAYFLHKYYPVTYRLSFWNEVKKRPMLDHFFELMEDADVENIDIQEIAKKLTAEQKKELFKIFNFDVDFYKKIIKNKRVHFFVIGHYLTYDDVDLQEWFLQHNSSDDILFIKGYSDQLYNRLIPAFSFPNQLPFEMLVIGGLMPTSVSGVSSSLFYSLPKENIGKIIYEKNDPNAETIKNLLGLSDEQIKFSEVKELEDSKAEK